MISIEGRPAGYGASIRLRYTRMVVGTLLSTKQRMVPSMVVAMVLATLLDMVPSMFPSMVVGKVPILGLLLLIATHNCRLQLI